MTPLQLKRAILEIYGRSGQRAMARRLEELGLIQDKDGSRIRKMLAGQRPIPPEIEAAVSEMRMQKKIEGAAIKKRGAPWKAEQLLQHIFERHRRASMLYALIVMRLWQMPEGMTTPELAEDLTGDANSSTVAVAITKLEAMGVVAVDRSGSPLYGGYPVRLTESARRGAPEGDVEATPEEQAQP